jgi:transposase
MKSMASKYDQETKDRVVRMFEERRSEAPEETQTASYRRLHELTGIPVDTMRGWVARAQIDAGAKPGLTTSEREEIKALKKELAEVKRANEILKTASAFFAAAELDRRLK